MAVKARFWVREITKFGNSDNMKVSLAPVVRGKGQPGYDPEANIDWSKYTPSGEVILNITAEGAQQWFEDRRGKDVAITFDDVE